MPLIIDLNMVAHDTRNNRLNFGARVDGLKAHFAITEKALRHLDLADKPYDTDALIRIVHNNAGLICAVAAELWHASRFESDGYILLCTADVMKHAHATA